MPRYRYLCERCGRQWERRTWLSRYDALRSTCCRREVTADRQSALRARCALEANLVSGLYFASVPGACLLTVVGCVLQDPRWSPTLFGLAIALMASSLWAYDALCTRYDDW